MSQQLFNILQATDKGIWIPVISSVPEWKADRLKKDLERKNPKILYIKKERKQR